MCLLGLAGTCRPSGAQMVFLPLIYKHAAPNGAERFDRNAKQILPSGNARARGVATQA